ncbi:MAG TPA: glycoside hydrolase family 44 protein [Solirubrobacteraceae bacterium]
MRGVAARMGGGALVVVAAILFAGASQPTPPTIVLTVNAQAGRHPISAYIYGLNFAKPRLAAAIQLPVNRWGGNSTDTYNWKLGSYNTGLDYYFENLSDCFLKPGRCTPAYRTFISANRVRGTGSLLNLPLVGRVARDAPRQHPVTCAFPASVYGPQQSVDPYDTHCGNGKSNSGRPLSPSPARDSIAVGASFYQGWLHDLARRYGTARQGGVEFYELGNEPSLWDSTHRDMHPRPETASELWRRSRQVTTLIRQVDRHAGILGLSEWGWPAYFCTAADTFGSGCGPDGCTTSPDCRDHGHLPMAAWLLKQFAAYDRRTGVRHLNYLDLHYYAQGGSGPDVTRSLWDPSYKDPSWIDDQIDLIPRMKRWVARYYPGTRVSLSEYNLSVTHNPVVNALIQADTLGIFARQGLNLATRWPLANDGGVIGEAFKMYRDYDGHHSEFGNTWVSSRSTGQSKLAVYAAQRSGDRAYTVLVVNKTQRAFRGNLRLSGFAPADTAATWQWRGRPTIVHVASTPILNDGVDVIYPARSMTLYVIRPRTQT